MKKIILSFSLLAFFFAISCKKETNKDGDFPESASKIAPDNFFFATTKKVTLDIRLLATDNTPLKGVPVQLYAPGKSDAALFKALTNTAGVIRTTLTIPSYLDTLVVDPQYVGLLSRVKVYISNNTLNCTIGGLNGYSGNIIAESIETTSIKNQVPSISSSDKTVYIYDSPYDESGKPLNLEPREIVSNDLLQYINYSLPERQDVRLHHPNYLADKAGEVLDIVKTADVWLTFVHEGATYLNTFGYYTYPTGNPPATAADIDTIHYIFPNSSAAGSGGGLFTGDKIKLGRFAAGTSIGFVLFSNSWNGNKVKNNVTKFYSNSELNAESSSDLRRHSVVLHHSDENIFLIGFEDKPRDDSSCDHDFNDVVFYAKSNPVDGISVTGIPPLDTPADQDGDGISDIFDEFPTDPNRAFINYFPSQNNWGTLAFEDQWPDMGDYDLNDLVVNYRYAFISNAQNNVVDLNADFNVVAVGASFENGFGVELPFNASLVKQVTGQRLISSYIQTQSNGLESGQSKAVIIPFDNTRAVITNPYGLFINTDKTHGNTVYGDTVRVKLVFNSPVTPETLGQAPFNPFLISNGRRGFEIHLPGHQPTAKADTKLFGVSYDNTNIAGNTFYISKDNWPWALNFLEPFSYPVETKGIHETYLHFLDWAKSGGTQYTDWYSNTTGNYRKKKNIY